MTEVSRGLTLATVLMVAVQSLGAQCPDGTPPPCRRAVAVGPRVAPAAPIDSATALVVPLSPIGADSSLRRLAATFAAVVAENMTVGEVRARVADNLAQLLVDQRAATAARAKAGAVVDGTLLRIGANVRAMVRLVDARTGQELAQATVEGSPDSLLAIADRASAVMLAAWWKQQPGTYARGGVVTTSLVALRHYINAMVQWRRGTSDWRSLLDSAVRHDPDFLAPWTWLALPTSPANPLMEMLSDVMAGMTGGISSDSARRALSVVAQRQAPASRRELLNLEPGQVTTISSGSFEPPTPTDPDPHAAFQDPYSERAVDYRYLGALALHYATLSGYPDTLALRSARRIVAVDSTFDPAWTLLFNELVDLGDSAGAAMLLARRPNLDSATAKDLRQTLAARMIDATRALGDSDPDHLATVVFLGGSWNRFRLILQVLPTMLRAMNERLPGPPAFQLWMKASTALPAYWALGMRDSARLVARSRHFRELGESTTCWANWRGRRHRTRLS